MSRYLLRRLLQLIPVLCGVILLVFFMVRLIPGDPVDVMMAERGNEETRQAMRRVLGVDKSILEQFGIFVSRLVRGDLGDSFVLRKPAMPEILHRFPRTLFLATYSTLLGVVIAVPLAMWSALKRGSVFDRVIRGFVALTMTMPYFWIALLLLIAFSVRFHVFPTAGFGDSFVENLYYLFLPAFSMAVAGSGVLLRNLRAVILETMQSDHVRTAHAKGLKRSTVFAKHVLRNSLISTVTLLGLRVAYSVGGAVIVENIFAIPGLGMFMMQSVLARDYPVIQAITFFLAVLVILASLLTDIVYALLDPRVRYE